MSNATDLITVHVRQTASLGAAVESVQATVRQFYELIDGYEEYVLLGHKYFSRESILNFWVGGEIPSRPMHDYEAWEQPTCLLTAYHKGDKVLCENGCIWESLVDCNMSKPSISECSWICLDGEMEGSFTLELMLGADEVGQNEERTIPIRDLKYEQVSAFLRCVANGEQIVSLAGTNTHINTSQLVMLSVIKE